MKKRGRPPMNTTQDTQETQVTPVKKGKPVSWKPASKLGKLTVPAGYVGRWCDNDQANIQKKLEEGWVMVNKTTYSQGRHDGSGHADSAIDSQGLGSAVQYRELVGMMLPEETRQARESYYQERTRKQMESKILLKDSGDSDVKRSAKMTGKLEIN